MADDGATEMYEGFVVLGAAFPAQAMFSSGGRPRVPASGFGAPETLGNVRELAVRSTRCSCGCSCWARFGMRFFAFASAGSTCVRAACSQLRREQNVVRARERLAMRRGRGSDL